MSIAEFLTDGGDVPGISDNNDFYSSHFGDPGAPRPTNNKAEREKLWAALCKDDRWKYREEIASDYQYFYGKEVSRPKDDYWGAKAKFETVPCPENMHRGAFAPNPVWGEMPSYDEVPQNSLEEYMRHLICIVTGRFVCLIEEQEQDNGIPEGAERYRWRYWDNNGRVYQDNGIKWTRSYYGQNDETTWIDDRLQPGNFGQSPLWMISEGSLDREFWEAVWCWKHEGTTHSESWDKGLWKLARQAGVVLHTDSWPLDEQQLDRLATEREWTKLPCEQPAKSSYVKYGEGITKLEDNANLEKENDDEWINFYLSTGTVGFCLNDPVQGKTKDFRRGMDMEKAAALLGKNPKEHNGRGQKRKVSEP